METGEDFRDVAAVLGGDVERFAGIVSRWEVRLVNLAYRFVRDRERAEEMAQEAFVQCFRRLRQWRGEGRFGTWLFGLALNVYRSRLRALGRVAVSEPLPENLADTEEGGPRRLLAAERNEIVRREVARLPPLYRDALVIFYFEERDVAAAAGLLGVPVGTLKARLHRGREMLKARLSEVLP